MKLLAIASVATIAAVAAAQAATFEMSAYVIGPGPQGLMKAQNLEVAAEALNQALAQEGSDDRVALEVTYSELKWDEFSAKFFLDFRAGNAPDIVTLREAAQMAEEGFIAPVDAFVSANQDSFGAFYDNLWEAARYEGQIWGVPHDIAPSGIWYRKDVLRTLGYSDAEIDQMLPADGNTTMDQLAGLAKEAVEAGLVDYGMLHRPGSGSGVYNQLIAFDVEMFDPESGHLVFDREGLKAFLDWHKAQVDAGVLPAEAASWSTIHSSFVEGRNFANLASHVGTPAEWIAQYGLTEETLASDLGFMPFPPATEELAGKVGPSSLSDVPLYMVTAQSEHPELAMRLIELATTAEAAARHSAYSARPPYRADALEVAELADNDYVQRVAPSAAAVRTAPADPDFWTYVGQVFQGLQGVEAGVASSDEIIAGLEAWFSAEVKDGIVR